jgi:hypothetical protein
MDLFQFYLSCGLIIIFILIGCFGNIISIIIFLKKEFITQSTTFYLITSAIVNIVTVFYLPVMIFAEIWNSSTILCKILGGFTLILLELQSWVYVLSSVDRCLTTIAPGKFLWKNKHLIQAALVSSCLFIIILLASPVIYFYEKSIVISSNETYNICTGPPGGVTWIFPYFQYQFIFLRIIIPFIITIIVSFLTIYKLCASKRKMGKIEWKNMRREVQFSRALIIMDILFIIFRLPTFINTILNNHSTFVYSFSYSIFGVLGAVHNVFLFFIFIVFNRIYRKLFEQSICCGKT